MVSKEDEMWTQLFEQQRNDIKTKDQMISEQIEAFATQVMAMERHNSSHAEAARKAMCQMLRMARYLIGEKKKETERANRNEQQIKDTQEQLRKQTEKLELALKEVEVWRNKEEETRARGQQQTAAVETLELRVTVAEQQRSECEKQMEVMKKDIIQLKEHWDGVENERKCRLAALLQNQSQQIHDELPLPSLECTKVDSSFQSTSDVALIDISEEPTEKRVAYKRKTEQTYACELCTKSFSTKHHLDEHFVFCNSRRTVKQIIHVDDVDEGYCRVCDRVFASRKALKIHQSSDNHKSINAFIKASKREAEICVVWQGINP